MEQRKTYGYISFALEKESDLGNCFKCHMLQQYTEYAGANTEYWCGASQIVDAQDDGALHFDGNIIPRPNWCPAVFIAHTEREYASDD